MRNKISLFVAAFSVVTAEFALAAEMPYMNLLRPDMIFVDGAANSSGRIKVKLSPCRCMRREIFVYLSGEGPVSKVELVWNIAFPKESVVYGGDWERTYGDSGWFRIGDSSAPHEGWKPWYFLVNDGTRTDGYGLMVQPNAFAAWKIAPGSVTLSLDVRAGWRPLELKTDQWGMRICTLVDRYGEENETPFAAAREFCRKMCPNPRLPKEPVYGYNDWYCAYGNNTATNFLADAEFIVSLVKGEKVRPYVVVDDGWQRGKQGSAKTTSDMRWAGVNEKWGMEMDEFARRVKAMGAKPGLWYRPFLPDDGKDLPIDPTDPTLENRIRADMARFAAWGFELVKADFITHDWSTSWGGGLSPIHHDIPEWSDRSHTTAEVVKKLYMTLREAAGDKMVIIGCNALDHFAAGLFEIQRTGDDTSGNDWGRTRKMGPNTLGMRTIHHGKFYVSDGDCFGLAKPDAIPWRLNSQWLDLVSRSGTALFVSWRRELTTPEIRDALEAALRRAAKMQPTGEPLDWLNNLRPMRWRFGDEIRTYNWE
ncbi:MAG: hypothetical protein IKU71_03555 [Kiritimatiellae bacterium]|nr:hypothetical protein [Kiritimatiellia bacterium]